MKTRVYVVGSIAYDRIMDFSGRFADHILPDKIHMLNVSFTVNGMVEHRGGTAGNIAYALAKLGESPRIFASIGHDHQSYFSWLEKHGIPHSSITVNAEEFTACAYITTDEDDNQITGFNPGAMRYPCRIEFEDGTGPQALGIVGASNLEDMRGGRNAFLDRGMSYIFDPGQSLPMWDKESLLAMIDGANVLIANEYEVELIISKTGLDKPWLLERCGAIITTRGEHGSTIDTKQGTSQVKAVKLEHSPVDPTGAGDAFRGGLISGMLAEKDLVKSVELGTVIASFAVEVEGTQTYDFSQTEFDERQQRTFT